MIRKMSEVINNLNSGKSELFYSGHTGKLAHCLCPVMIVTHPTNPVCNRLTIGSCVVTPEHFTINPHVVKKGT
jgi:hypothetical protein